MADWSWENGGGDSGNPGWLGAEIRSVFDGASILLVEDDADIRDLLTTLLQIAGFQTTACSTAEAALEELREQPFDLVLTDYMLPHRTGGWLLQQASEEGLLDATPVLVVTAHPNPADVRDYEIVQKPFDLDDLVGKVRRRLGAEGSKRPRMPISAPLISKRPGDQGDGDCPDPIELVLYVSAHSPRSAAAIENIKRVVSRFASSRVQLTICDLSQEPTGGDADSVAFTPTLVKRSPGPRTYILGHLANPEVLVELLDGCEES
jgi:DNA-binding response OmpR family regulator